MSRAQNRRRRTTPRARLSRGRHEEPPRAGVEARRTPTPAAAAPQTAARLGRTRRRRLADRAGSPTRRRCAARPRGLRLTRREPALDRAPTPGRRATRCAVAGAECGAARGTMRAAVEARRLERRARSMHQPTVEYTPFQTDEHEAPLGEPREGEPELWPRGGPASRWRPPSTSRRREPSRVAAGAPPKPAGEAPRKRAGAERSTGRPRGPRAREAAAGTSNGTHWGRRFFVLIMLIVSSACSTSPTHLPVVPRRRRGQRRGRRSRGRQRR